MKKFKPMLAIDATKHIENIQYPKFVSYKLDGIRLIVNPEKGLLSRALKPIQNQQICEKFAYLIDKAKYYNRIFDGELYSHNLTFQEISRIFKTEDFHSEKTIKKLIKELGSSDNVAKYIKNLISNIEFHCFDTYSHQTEEPFRIRNQVLTNAITNISYIPVRQKIVNSKEDIKALFEKALSDGYEGLILRDIDSPYKFGRSTLKEEYMLKVKPFETFDAKIIGVEQATVVNPNAEKKINELGRSVTSKKKGDRIHIDMAKTFIVEYEGQTVKPVIAMTNPEKEEIWKNKESYIGRMIEYKGMLVGAKDVPRHPVFIRFIESETK